MFAACSYPNWERFMHRDGSQVRMVCGPKSSASVPVPGDLFSELRDGRSRLGLVVGSHPSGQLDVFWSAWN